VKKLDLIITGVGGQGVILASDIIGETAIAAGYDVKKTDTLGMAQRGGSVISNLRIGSEVYSPLIKEGEADILLAFEKLEAVRWAYYLMPQGTAIVNNHARPPLSVGSGNTRYPTDSEVMDILKQQTDSVYFVNGTGRAREMGNIRMLNTYILGCISVFLPFDVPAWEKSIAAFLPPKLKENNIGAFNQGRKEVQSARL